MNEIRVKLEFTVSTPRNVNDARNQIALIGESVGRLVAAAVDGPEPAKLRSYSASYNTPNGRKPE